MRILSAALISSLALLSTTAASPPGAGDSTAMTAPAGMIGGARDDAPEPESIEGADSSTDAPALEPGTYTDVVRGEGTSRYYAIDVPADGGLAVTVTGDIGAADQRSGSETLSIELMTPSGTTCATVEDGLNLLDGEATLSTGVVFSEHLTGEIERGCLEAERLLAHVYNSGDETDIPVELTVWTFSEVLDAAELPDAVDLDEYEDSIRTAEASGETRTVEGGSGLLDAATVEPGVYRDSIKPGETRAYRLNAGWGQTPRFTATLGSDNSVEEALGFSSLGVDASWATPLRTIHEASSGADGSVSNSAGYSGDRPAAVTATLPQVRFMNQGSSEAPLYTASLPGYHYFFVSVESDSDAAGLDIPLQVQVELEGEVSGVPEFAGELLGPEDQIPGGDGFAWLAPTMIALGSGLIIAAVVLSGITVRRRRRT